MGVFGVTGGDSGNQTEHPSMVNTLVLLNETWFGEFEGPFEFERDGGLWEVVIPADPEDYAGIHKEQASSMAQWDSRIALALADGEVEAHGTTVTMDYLPDEGKLVVVVDSSQYLGPGDVDLPEGVSP